MIEKMYFMTLIDIFFLLIAFILLDTVKIRTKKNELRVEVCKIRFVLATIIIGITVIQVILEIIDNELPQQTLLWDIIAIPTWVAFCFKERKEYKQK